VGRPKPTLHKFYQRADDEEHDEEQEPRHMKFGLHYLLACSDTQSPFQRYRDTVEQAVHAEGLGFESVWPVEQHFNQAQSAMPCPTLLLAAIAERTRSLRLGTAIVQLPLAHPLRIAEEIATLDVLSGGRVEFGVGRGSNPKHFAGFGIPLSESRERFIEGLDYLHQAWSNERFSVQGRFFQADDVCLVPRPLQRPHPPIRIAANSAETAEFAGRSGYPIIVAAHINPFPKLREILPVYHNARKQAGHPEATSDDLSMLMPLYVGESREQVQHDVEPAVTYYVQLLASLLASGAGKWTSEAESKKMELLLAQVRRTNYAMMNDSMAIFDTPEACIERLKGVQQEFNIGRVICWFNLVGAIPHARVMRSMELFSARVLPYV
jgi:alkanesulfonate monooxygenase SsuD/methylene tetrahydromethanopterin reductase-like flavin-dependent oxidoreductase (luciferase family)